MPKVVKQETIVAPVAKRKYTVKPKLPPRPEPKHTSHAFLTFLVIINLVATSWIAYQIYDAKYMQEVQTETQNSDPHSNL